MIITGIDPGLHGGIAVLENNEIKYLSPMPVKNGIVDVKEVKSIFFHYPSQDIFLESLLVFAAKQGSQGISTSGKNWGRVAGVVEWLGLNLHEVEAKIWQKTLFVPKGTHAEIKLRILKRAQILFPNANFIPKGCRKPHDGMVDALMIAKYGMMTLNK